MKRVYVMVDAALAGLLVAVMATALVREAPREYLGVALFAAAFRSGFSRDGISTGGKSRYHNGRKNRYRRSVHGVPPLPVAAFGPAPFAAACHAMQPKSLIPCRCI